MDMGHENIGFLHCARHLSPEVCDTTEQGWEEKADLLRFARKHKVILY